MSFWSKIRTRIAAAWNPDVNYESRWIVTVSDTQLSCRRPNGIIESVDWDDLKSVIIETTDEGPQLPDVFWLLIGEKSGCVVTLGATGEDAMLEKLQSLPHFSNQALAEAMSSTSNCRFICWQKSETT